MKITIFTSNQPRHISLIESLAKISDQVFAVMECSTVFPGKYKDFYHNSEVMKRYFTKVTDAEKTIFGEARFLKEVSTLSVKMGDLNLLSYERLKPALNSDIFVIFGSSYIKGDLCDFLVNKRAINIHMGISPFYRGNGCNFWALYDKKPDYVGATIHYLSKGLDSGSMLFHVLPKVKKYQPFELGMNAVKAAHMGLVDYIRTGQKYKLKPVKQDKKKEIKYTKLSDFTDKVALDYLNNLPSSTEIFSALKKRDLKNFLRPFVF